MAVKLRYYFAADGQYLLWFMLHCLQMLSTIVLGEESTLGKKRVIYVRYFSNNCVVIQGI